MKGRGATSSKQREQQTSKAAMQQRLGNERNKANMRDDDTGWTKNGSEPRSLQVYLGKWVDASAQTINKKGLSEKPRPF
jgi:hypothetical protein